MLERWRGITINTTALRQSNASNKKQPAPLNTAKVTKNVLTLPSGDSLKFT